LVVEVPVLLVQILAEVNAKAILLREQLGMYLVIGIPLIILLRP
jgi:hypothetical protein